MQQFWCKALAFGPSIVTQSLNAGEVSLPYSMQLSATSGDPPYTWSLVSGSMPSGLTLSLTGLISGTPLTAGTYNPRVQVTDNAGGQAQRTYSFLIINAPIITTTSPLPGGSSGVVYTPYTMTAVDGRPPYSWSLISQTGANSWSITTGGIVTGTPTSSETDSLVIQVQDINGVQTQGTFTITVSSTLQITTTSPLPGASQGNAYSYTMNASGGTPAYSWTLVSQTGGNAWSVSSAGVVTGTPSISETDSLVIKVQDSAANTQQGTFTITTTGTVGTPIISPAAGNYSPPQAVTITDATSGASIYYTIDGTTPTYPVTGTTTLYTGAFNITINTTVKAIGVLTGSSQSAVATNVYTLTLTPGWS